MPTLPRLAVKPGWDSAVRIGDRAIPEYDALRDPNCTYTQSRSFRTRYTAILAKQQQTPQRRPPLQQKSLPRRPVSPIGGSAGALSLRSRSAGALPGAPTVPNLELSALKAIEERELHLARLHSLLAQQPMATDPGALAALRADIAEALLALRLAGIAVVEAVVRWRRRRRRKLEPFVWRSHNYLLKMLVDVFFLGLSQNVADAAADPFLLRCFEVAAPPSRPSTVPSPSAGMPRAVGGHVAPIELPSADVGSSSGEPGNLAPGMVGGSGPETAVPSRRKQLAVFFSPNRRHTKHHLVRMWAAERVLATERKSCADFVPMSPVLESADVEVRNAANHIFFGVGETSPQPLAQTRPASRFMKANPHAPLVMRPATREGGSRAKTSADGAGASRNRPSTGGAVPASAGAAGLLAGPPISPSSPDELSGGW